MKISDLIVMSVRSLWRRKLRTFLTILGVVIGASSIILMLSLGIAMDRNFREQMESMGSLTVINVYPNNYGDPNAPKLDDKAIETMKALPGVQRVIPQLRTNATLEYGKYRTSWQVEVIGLDPEDMTALGYKVGQGRNMEIGDKNVILLGFDITRQFVKKGKKMNWNNVPPAMEFALGTDKVKLDIGNYDYMTGKPATDNKGNSVSIPKANVATVIGVFAENDWETSYYAFVPNALFEKIVKDKEKYEKKLYGENNNFNSKDENKYQNIRVKVASEGDVLPVQDALKEMNFGVYSSMEYLNEMKKVSNSIQVILGGIGAISLFVAAIGITNTMMMSIYERTKEIGVMKVIGAKIVDIKKMFLVEALMIGAVGGTVGVIFSYILSFLINRFGGALVGNMMGMGGSSISVIPVWLAGAALLFSTLIGLISGYFPAKRAMKLSALSAIRTE